MTDDRTDPRDAAGNKNAASKSPVMDQAVADLLDHIAEELALEYVRLMEKAAGEERFKTGQNEDEED